MFFLFFFAFFLISSSSSSFSSLRRIHTDSLPSITVTASRWISIKKLGFDEELCVEWNTLRWGIQQRYLSREREDRRNMMARTSWGEAGAEAIICGYHSSMKIMKNNKIIKQRHKHTRASRSPVIKLDNRKKAEEKQKTEFDWIFVWCFFLLWI